MRSKNIAVYVWIYLLLLGIALLIARPAEAQGKCAPFEGAAKNLDEKFGELLLGSGESPRGTVYFFLNPENGSFTIIGRPKGNQVIGCVLDSGKNFTPSWNQEAAPGPKKKPREWGL